MNLLGLAIIVVALLPALLSARLRTPRALFVFVGLTATFLAAAALPDPWSAAVKVAAVWIYVVALLGFQHWLAGMSRADAAFDKKLRGIANEARAAEHARAPDILDKRAAVVNSLNALEPPSAAWARLVTLFRAYYRELLEPEPGDPAAADSEFGVQRLGAYREQIKRAWEDALRAPPRA